MIELQRVRLTPVERLRVGDRFYWAGLLVEVHRIQERPTAGYALVVEDPTYGPRFRRLFYKLGEEVEVLRHDR